MPLALSALLCLPSGFALVSLGWSRRISLTSDWLLRASLSVGYGLGLFSITYFLCLLLGITHLILVDLAVFAALAVACLMRARSAPGAIAIAKRNTNVPLWFHRVVTATFALASGAALYSAVMHTLAHPHGDGWDAFAIWNLHARFLFRGGPYWRDGFTPLLPWSRFDYPLLLPAAFAHFWTYLGHDSPAIPAMIGFLFTLCTAALLFSSLSVLRGRIPAMLATIALVATPAYIEQGTWQYADIPLSFFYLATIALICLYDDRTQPDAPRSSGLLALAGLAAAFAAWTKNEGVLFLCAIVLSLRLVAHSDARRGISPQTRMRLSQIAPLLLTIAPIFLLVTYFKHFVAPPTPLFSDPGSWFHKLLDPARYWAIIQWYVKGFFRFGRWLWIPGTIPLVLLYLVAGKQIHSRPQSGMRASVLALALTLAGYFAVYLITPYDLYWHLRFSLARLFVQVWPSAIFLCFLAVRVGEELP